jgi:hypothetical protein
VNPFIATNVAPRPRFLTKTDPLRNRRVRLRSCSSKRYLRVGLLMSLLSCRAFCRQAEPANSAPPEPSGSSRIFPYFSQPGAVQTAHAKRRNLGIATLVRAWLKVMIENRRVILRTIVECFTRWRSSVEGEVSLDFDAGARKPSSKRSRASAAEAAVAHFPFVLLDAQKRYAAPGSTSSET